ncbi:carbon-nitrogen family hydrolase [Poriferisphaera corsica]|nr:carbon-nitrogen family hydrolase [Poriferisphaera corsica]
MSKTKEHRTQQVIGVQFDIAWEDREMNYERVEALLDERCGEIKKGAMVCLPEMFSTGFSLKVNKTAEGDEVVTEKFMKRLARKYEVYMMGGLVERDPRPNGNRKGLNLCVVMNPEGEEVCRYTKIHPFSYGQETDFYNSGDEVVTFKWGELTVAPFVCYDVRFPEIFRHGAAKGAEVITVIANFPEKRIAHWVTLNQARAIENQAIVVAVNRVGDDPFLAYNGRSLVIDALGEIRADGGEDEGLVMWDIDLDVLDEYRGRFPALRDMREDFLGLDE